MTDRFPEASPTPDTRIPINKALDGIRAIAISLVLLYHVGVPLLGFGWIGVDLFFVLSGFLITSLLCKEYSTTGTISFKNFLVRRFLRIMPIYWLYATLITVLILGGFGWTTTDGPFSPYVLIASIWGYFNNFLPRSGIWEHDHDLVAHLWSLSVEEQFYVIWPGLFLFAARKGRALPLCAALCAGMFFIRYLQGGNLNYMLHVRGIGLALGCLVAIIAADEHCRMWCNRWLSQRSGMLSIYALNLVALTGLAMLTQLRKR